MASMATRKGGEIRHLLEMVKCACDATAVLVKEIYFSIPGNGADADDAEVSSCASTDLLRVFDVLHHFL